MTYLVLEAAAVVLWQNHVRHPLVARKPLHARALARCPAAELVNATHDRQPVACSTRQITRKVSLNVLLGACPPGAGYVLLAESCEAAGLALYVPGDVLYSGTVKRTTVAFMALAIWMRTSSALSASSRSVL